MASDNTTTDLDIPATQTFESINPAEEDDLDLDQPLALHRATRTWWVPAHFRKSGDPLLSAQMAAMTNYSQALTPESSPTPSLASSPIPISWPPSPMPVDRPSHKPIIHETVPNHFGLYWHFTTWPSVDPVMHFVRSMHEQTKNNKQCDKGALYVWVLITKSSWAEMRQIK